MFKIDYLKNQLIYKCIRSGLPTYLIPYVAGILKSVRNIGQSLSSVELRLPYTGFILSYYFSDEGKL